MYAEEMSADTKQGWSNGATSATDRVSEISEQLNVLDKEQEHLGSIVAQLRERLRPAMNETPIATGEKRDGETKSRSDIARRIVIASERTTEMRQYLQYILSVLEI